MQKVKTETENSAKTVQPAEQGEQLPALSGLNIEELVRMVSETGRSGSGAGGPDGRPRYLPCPLDGVSQKR